MHAQTIPPVGIFACASGALIACAGAAPALGQFLEPDVEVIHRFDGPQPGVGASYGWAVAEMSDLDGDGALDAIIGQPFGDGGVGRTQVRSGATGAVLFDIPGGPGSLLGFSMGDAGDVDADGIPDFVSGGPGGDGIALVYSGLDGSLILRIDAPDPEVLFGYAVAGAGDVDLDGHADVLVGEPNFNLGAGRAFVMSGADGSVLRTYEPPMPANLGVGIANAGDIDGDGRDDHIIGSFAGEAYVHSGADGTLIHTLVSPSPNVFAFGQFFVGGLADTNADGVRDLYVGDFGVDSDPADGIPAEGEAYVFSGADGSLLQTFVGAPGDGFGPGRGAGDHDNDGCEDIAVGGYTSSAGAPGAGRIALYSGFDGSLLKTYTSTEAGANVGFDCVGIGDVDGDGGLDILGSGATGDVVFVLAGDPRPCAADVNRDGKVNVFDFVALLKAFDEYDRFADLDHDGDVDIYDFVEWIVARRACR